MQHLATHQAEPATETPQLPRKMVLPDLPFMALKLDQLQFLDSYGEIETCAPDAARLKIETSCPIVCYRPFMQRRLGLKQLMALDILELFAFIYPARHCVPTVQGVCQALHLEYDQDDPVMSLYDAARKMLERLTETEEVAPLVAIAQSMKGWGWRESVLAALGAEASTAPVEVRGLKVWRTMPEWSEHAPEAESSHLPVSSDETEIRLSHWIKQKSGTLREAQLDYSQHMARAFHPRNEEGVPHIVLAEAGTGIGKTLGYLAPATLWAEKNEGTVWISTYTKNLQRQIDDELDLHFTDPAEKQSKVVLRKGRENYLCLLNFEEMVQAVPTAAYPDTPIVAGLIARWIQASRDGDMKSGDLPGWLHSIAGGQKLAALSDRRGECIHSACPHYNKCFIEKSIRQSRRARVVVANHALVMIQNALAAMTAGDDAPQDLPTRYIFDEGHHLFDAADGAFACHLTAMEGAELKRWIGGTTQGRNRMGRAKGLKARMETIPDDQGDYAALVEKIIWNAQLLPDAGWRERLAAQNPKGSCESFLLAAREFILAREGHKDGFYSLETAKNDLPQTMVEHAAKLHDDLVELKIPVIKLIARLENDIVEKQDEWDPEIRRRAESLANGLKRRLIGGLEGWIGMLALIDQPTPDDFVDWFELERTEGQEIDVGFYRHWKDPTKPFVKTIENHLHGMGVTSATLSAGDIINPSMVGLEHFGKTPELSVYRTKSPYDYASRTKVLVVSGLNMNDPAQISAAYASLFSASHGGALGIFTAIQRLKTVQDMIGPQLIKRGIPLYSQHVDGLDPSTLIDIFRAEEHACLLGTDALRDGVDVPGNSLRLIVFDRVPWPRPTLLHKERRALFGGKDYDDDMTRMKLKQAYGRLIRSEQDRGVFVILDSRLPTRLLNAFPEDVSIERVDIKDALETVRQFFS